MNFVQPIRKIQKITEIYDFYYAKSERNAMLFLFGVYTGLRISDILARKVSDIKGHYIDIREKKTGKQRRIRIPPDLNRELKKYIQNMDKDEYLFQSRKGINKPLTRSAAYRVLREAADEFGLDSIGTHTLRKTFGYHFYQQTKDVVKLQQHFNHSSEMTTKRYIGVIQDELDKSMMNFSYR